MIFILHREIELTIEYFNGSNSVDLQSRFWAGFLKSKARLLWRKEDTGVREVKYLGKPSGSQVSVRFELPAEIEIIPSERIFSCLVDCYL